MRENEEIVDVLDECGEIVDRTSVANAHQNGLKHRVVAVFVVLDGNELILQTRADNGLLDFSVLGHVRAGEEASVAAKREMREELDLAGEPKFVCEYENKPSPRGHLWGIFFWNCSSPLVFYPTAEVSEIILVNGGDLTRRIRGLSSSGTGNRHKARGRPLSGSRHKSVLIVRLA